LIFASLSYLGLTITTAILLYLFDKRPLKSIALGLFLLVPFVFQVLELIPLIQHTKQYPILTTIPNHTFSALTETLSYSGTLICLAILITLAILKIDN
jgi:hypothetical protein